MLNKFRVEEGKAEKLVLIKVHHKQFVGWCKIQLLRCKLLVEIADIFPVFL